MVEKINLSTFELVSNNLLVRPDSNYGFIEVATPEGTIKLFTSPMPEHEAKNFAISGQVVKCPDSLLFHGELLTHQKGITISDEDFSSMMRNSMPYATELAVQNGDNILFNYGVQIDAINEGRVFEVEGIGKCMLVPYEQIFAKRINDELVPVNGWIIFKRDVIERETQLPSGLWAVDLKATDYTSQYGTVISADKPVTNYLDKSHDGEEQLHAGDRIIIQKNFGYRIAYDPVAGELKDTEVCRYKNVLGTVN